MSRIARWVLIAGLILLPAAPFRADVYQVTKSADTNDGACDADCSLREAIEAANAHLGADDVPVPAGTYLLTLGELLVTDDLSLVGAGPETTLIDGNAASRVLEIPVNGVFSISGVTIRNGHPTCCGDRDAGGIALAVGKLTLTDSTVSGNSSDDSGYGGGISNRLGRLMIANSTVNGNTADQSGGGIWSKNGLVVIEGSTIYGNAAASGGGILVYGGSLDLVGSVVARNTTADGGGGIRIYDGVATISSSTVSGNSADMGAGGGIYSYAGSLALDRSTVASNYAYSGGGGVYSDTSPIVLTNSTVSGNTVALEGGGISINGESATIANSTLTDNLASTYGGGIANESGTVYLADVIVAENHAFAGGPNCFGAAVTSLGYNLADDTSCDLSEPSDLVVADAMLGPLQDNGGPTETHALLPGSPAIDAGSMNCPPPATDQRGVARPQGLACDIGAVEYLPEPGSSLALIAGAGVLGFLYRRRC